MKILAFAVFLAAMPAAAHAQINVGKRGQLMTVAMGCPNQPDVSNFIDSLSKAKTANDSVGENEAVQTALAAGCQPFPAGKTGLIIDWSGFLEQYGKIRFDASPDAYWFPAEIINPVGGASGN